MSDEIAALYLPPAAPWSELMTRAVARPSVRSYERLAHDRGASARRAYGWVFWTASIGALISIGVELLAGEGDASFQSLRRDVMIAAIVDVLMFAVATGAIHLVARLLGGTGTYAQLAFTTAAFYTPFLVLSALLAIGYLIAPPIGAVVTDTVALGLWACVFVLTVIAIKAVHAFSWPRSIAAASPVLLGYGGLVMLFTIILLIAG